MKYRTMSGHFHTWNTKSGYADFVAGNVSDDAIRNDLNGRLAENN